MKTDNLHWIARQEAQTFAKPREFGRMVEEVFHDFATNHVVASTGATLRNVVLGMTDDGSPECIIEFSDGYTLHIIRRN